jgi:aryl-alcohol dehydrogenase-like predicted oxidoreductase
MKVLSRGVTMKIFGVELVQNFVRFALTQPVSSVVIGCETMEQLEMNVKILKSFVPMTTLEQHTLITRVKPYARELMYYKF